MLHKSVIKKKHKIHVKWKWKLEKHEQITLFSLGVFLLSDNEKKYNIYLKLSIYLLLFINIQITYFFLKKLVKYWWKSKISNVQRIFLMLKEIKINYVTYLLEKNFKQRKFV